MTNEQNNQVAAMNASGMSIDEIVSETQIPEARNNSEESTANEKRAAEGLPPISSEFCEELTAVSCGTREKQALEIAKKKMLEIYETLTPEECRAWEMGEVYAEIVRGLR